MKYGARREEGPQNPPAVAVGPWASGLPNWEEMCFSCLCHQVSVMSKAAAVEIIFTLGSSEGYKIATMRGSHFPVLPRSLTDSK